MDQYVNLARRAIENYIRDGIMIDVPDDLPADFYERRAGVFVTIFNHKELRGCIGTYLPTTDNLASEIVANAIAACSRDDRFSEIAAGELPELDYEVSLLSRPEPVLDIKKLNPKKYGVIVAVKGGRSGLLLPDLEGVETINDQLTIAANKGGIDIGREAISVYSFTVEKHVD